MPIVEVVSFDPPSVLSVRLRRTMARPVTRRAIAVAVAAVTGVTVTTQARAADAARSRWSDTRAVAVARHDLHPGERLDAEDAEVRELPAEAVAASAMGAPPVGVVVRYPIAAGEPLVAERLGAEGLTGVAALLPPGHRAVAIPIGPLGAPPVAVGDAVDVVAIVPSEADLHGHGDLGDLGDLGDPSDGSDPGAAGGGETAPDGNGESGDPDEQVSEALPAFPLVERAPVVDVNDETVTVAVPAADTPTVAYAAAQGSVVLALTGA